MAFTPASDILSRFTVLDLTRVRSGPTCVRQLADWGANVIKIEATGNEAGDIGGARHGSDFQNLHRNKRSITLNLKTEEGVAIFKKMAETADVIVENYRPDVKFRLGIDYETIRATNSRIVYASISGFGQDGPIAKRPGFDQIAQGMGGLMSVTGEPDGMPMKIGVAVVDVLTGTNAATAILAAVMHAQRTGTGQHIDMSLFDVSVASLANQALNYLVSGKAPGRLGNSHPNIVPYQAFATADGHVILAVGNDSQFRKFCAVAGCDGLADDPAYATNRARVENRQQLLPHITAAFQTQTTGWWLDQLAAVGVPAGPINSIDAVLDEPQAQHRGLSASIADDLLGSVPTIASPMRLSETPPQATLPPPRLGAHSREVLSEILTMDSTQLDRLVADGIIGDAS